MTNISVIVTIYNIKEYIQDCLDSILSQADVKYEIICVDDASTDGSELILDEYEKKYDNLKVIHRKSNGGHATARNEGYRHAVGEYLYTIDGDDMLVKDALSVMYRYAKEYRLDLLAFEAKAFFDNDSLCKYGSENEYIRKCKYPGVYSGPELFAKLMKNSDRVMANRVLYCYKRTYFLDNNLFDEEGLRYADDSMFAYYITAKRAMCISQQLYLRRYRQGSTVTSPMQPIYLESLVVLFWLELNRWHNLEFSDEINEQISNYFDLRLWEINRMMIKFGNGQEKFDYLISHTTPYYFYKRFIKAVPIYTKYISDVEMEAIRTAEHIILYGAGRVANDVSTVLEYNGIYDYDVVVTSLKKNNTAFKGKKIRNIADLTDKTQSLVIVAMSQENQKGIEKVLDSYGFSNVVWIGGLK